ncbi:MAG: ion channel [Acidobacteriota bacterium]|nr:ion channel [Acidobacteriota bacterium]
MAAADDPRQPSTGACQRTQARLLVVPASRYTLATAHTRPLQQPKTAHGDPPIVSSRSPLRPAGEDPNRDLGFGSVVASESRQRLLNPDGTFNVKRDGLRAFSSLSLYHDLLSLSWPRFLALVVTAYLAANALFALGYVACGAGAIQGVPAASMGGSEFLRCFFFSVQTFATIGYGHLSPVGLAANLLVTVESLFGLLGFALATGILFSRFSRPTARIIYSSKAIITPYQGSTAFEFRIVNARSNQLVEVEATVLLSWMQDGKVRSFQPLRLERQKVIFFPLAWTVVHPIDSDSPLYGITAEELAARNAEFLVLLTGIDETFSQQVHSRSSYKTEEIAWGAKFGNIWNPPRDGILSIDIGRLHDIVPAQLPG